jgi:signal transduction histidine kinase
MPEPTASEQTAEEALRFQPRARLMTLLGDQLIRDSGIAVFELVKNAYDADATYCEVVLKRVDRAAAEAEITVKDDGVGMDLDTVKKAWLEPGTDMRKQQRDAHERTRTFRRLPMGEKGVGRFAVHKLGNRTTLITRRAGQQEVVVKLDWNIFKTTTYLKDVPIDVSTREPQLFVGDQTGTFLQINDLNECPWTRGRVRSLYRAITSICSPFELPENFSPRLVLEGLRERDWLKGLLVAQDVMDQAPFRFKGAIKGSSLHYDYDFLPGAKLDRVDPRKCSRDMVILAEDETGDEQVVTVDETTIGEVNIEFYIFDRSPQVLKLTATDAKGLKDFLDQNGGVRVYRDGIRVFDYGEPGNDWLNLGGRRVNVPADRIGNNQVIGAVRLHQELSAASALIEKTNREGFVENDAFRLFHKAILFAIQQAEQERNIDKKRIRVAYAKAKEKELVIADLIELRNELKTRNLEDELGPIMDRIETQYRQVTERLLVAAGAGLNLSMVLHEAERTIHDLRDALERGEQREALLARARQLSEMVDGLAWLTRKSGISEVQMSVLVSHAISTWRFRFTHHNISVKDALTLRDRDFAVKGYRRLLLTCLMNLIDNAIYWLNTRAEHRMLYIGTASDMEGGPALIVADNGPGFLDPPDILTEPFFTRKPTGMGLGLHIAGEVMKQHKGNLQFPDADEVGLPPEYTGAVLAMQFPKQV